MDIILNTFLGPSGLSRAGQEYFRLLTKNKIRVIPRWLRLSPDDVQYVNQKLREEMLKASAFQFSYDNGFCQFYVGPSNNISLMNGRKLGIASIVHETSSLSAEQVNAIRTFDLVLSPSTFCRNACLSSGLNPKNVFHVPYPLNTEQWNPGITPSQKKDDGIFRFLYMNTPFERKGIDLLIIAWLQEFKKGENVELVIKTYQEHVQVFPKNLITNIANKNKLCFSLAAPVRIYDQAMEDEEVPSFMKSFDALVSPHRSEGFGMNPWYAMALGIPVICTNYGGTMDFAKQDLTWLVDLAGYSTPSQAECSIFQNLRGARWAEPDIESLKSQMRACYNDTLARKQKAEAGAIYVEENYNDEVVKNLLKNALDSKSTEFWEQLTLTGNQTLKTHPKMKDNKATMLEV